MPNYTVKFPDGQSVTFSGPPNMSDVDAFDRATQERKVKEGTIQTTWFGGASKQASQEPGLVGPAIAGAGTLAATAGAPVAVASGAVAAAPLAARWIQYASQKYFGDKPDGQEPEAPSASENALLATEGIASGYGAQIAGAFGKGVGSLTRAHQLPNGQWVTGLKGSGVLPWVGRTAGELAERGGIQAESGMLNPEAVVSRARSGMGQMADALKKALSEKVVTPANKPVLSAAEMARALSMVKAGVPKDRVLELILSQRVKS